MSSKKITAPSSPPDSATGLTAILPRKEPVQERSRLRFERILEVSRDLIVEKGVDVVSMKDVAETAGISVASLYQYFPDKAAIIATLAHRYNVEGEACVAEIVGRVHVPADLGPALAGVLEAYYEFFLNVPGSHAIWQASLADVRLHPLDDEHCETTSRILARGLARACPGLRGKMALRHGRLFTVLIASVVRKAITLSAPEGRATIEAYRKTHLEPALRTLQG